MNSSFGIISDASVTYEKAKRNAMKNKNLGQNTYVNSVWQPEIGYSMILFRKPANNKHSCSTPSIVCSFSPYGTQLKYCKSS